MFCMGCGAETPPRATACPVCGRELGRPVSTARATAGEDTQNAHPEQMRTVHPPSASPPMPSIATGDLDMPGFPRDALGRAVLFTAIAMIVDFLAPWVNVDGVAQISPSVLGLPVLLPALALGLAALPVFRASLRAQPQYAALPLVIGAVSFGATAVIWLRTAFAAPLQAALGNTAGDGPVYEARIGLYLFLLGAAVLTITGYQLFLNAATANAAAQQRATTTLAQKPAVGSASARSATSVASATAMPVGALAGTLIDPPTEAVMLPAQPVPVSQLAEMPSAPVTAPAVAVETAHENGHSGIALPGSPAWNQAPALPSHQRPSPAAGWPRHPNMRRR
ncbi:MAG TPA: hypothetical protein VJR48_01955 [Ktedonobacterales bacterium]|nr:hypothetical protein [Ktedonobacterales bacterium]